MKFVNMYDEEVFCKELDDGYMLQARRAKIVNGDLAGTIDYEAYLYKKNVPHHIYLRIAEAMFNDDNKFTDEEHIESLNDKVLHNLDRAIAQYERILAALEGEEPL